jgi:hypothetical protein
MSDLEWCSFTNKIIRASDFYKSLLVRPTYNHGDVNNFVNRV